VKTAEDNSCLQKLFVRDFDPSGAEQPKRINCGNRRKVVRNKDVPVFDPAVEVRATNDVVRLLDAAHNGRDDFASHRANFGNHV
jgi:hypothetical protein